MSLIRLLTTTRSLRDVKNEPSPYRMSEQGLLPKFGPRKKASDDAGPAGEDELAKAKENLGEGHGNRTDADCSLKAQGSRKPGWLAGWWQKLFARQPRRERQGPVQAEFSLDLVQVVRNDLRDVDETQNASTGGARDKDKVPPVERKPEEESVFGASRG